MVYDLPMHIDSENILTLSLNNFIYFTQMYFIILRLSSFIRRCHTYLCNISMLIYGNKYLIE